MLGSPQKPNIIMDQDDFSAALAENVRTLREAAGLTQARLAEKAGVPRSTLGLMESGEGNPTLAVVLAVRRALGVRLEELLEPPPSDTLLYRADELPQKRRGTSTVRQLLPNSLEGVELEELLIPPGQTLVGVPHHVGTREYLLVQSGELTLHLAGEEIRASEGDVVVFRGHQKHSYRNPCRKAARAVSVIAHAVPLWALRD